MAEAIEIGTISSRGQVAIPTDIREKMRLKEGEKVLFFLQGDSLLMRKVQTLSWENVTRPLREATKKIREEDVVGLVHKVRREKKE